MIELCCTQFWNRSTPVSVSSPYVRLKAHWIGLWLRLHTPNLYAVALFNGVYDTVIMDWFWTAIHEVRESRVWNNDKSAMIIHHSQQEISSAKQVFQKLQNWSKLIMLPVKREGSYVNIRNFHRKQFRKTSIVSSAFEKMWQADFRKCLLIVLSCYKNFILTNIFKISFIIPICTKS